MRPGETKLRAALRQWRPYLRGDAAAGSPTSGAPPEAPSPDPPADSLIRWWPRLTAPQVQALLGAAITLALLLWDQVRQRLGQP